MQEEAQRGTGTESPRRPEPEDSRAGVQNGSEVTDESDQQGLGGHVTEMHTGLLEKIPGCAPRLLVVPQYLQTCLFVFQSWELPTLNKRLE